MFKKINNIIVTAIMIVAVFNSSAIGQDFDKVDVKTHDLGHGIYMLRGVGGNIGLSVGADGVFMIDSDIIPVSDKIMAAVATVTDKPVNYIINTHWHGDHTGANAVLGASGTVIVAHDNVRSRMVAAQGQTASPESAFPVLTFSQTSTFYYNGHEIHAYHPAHAHTDGDAIILFKDINVIHAGDVLFNGLFPFIDTASGGSVDGYIQGLKSILANADGDTKIIPGHGPLASKVDVKTNLDMLVEAKATMNGLIAAGRSLDEIHAENPYADLDAVWSWQFINTKRFTAQMYNALKNE